MGRTRGILRLWARLVKDLLSLRARCHDAFHVGVAMIIEIDESPVGPNGPKGLLRMHWKTRSNYYALWLRLIRAQISQPGCATSRRVVRIHQIRKRLMDVDNLYASCKPILDGLKRWRLIRDDAPGWIDLTCTQEVGREVKTIIEVS